MHIVKLFDESAILLDLQKRTVDLIHATNTVPAIKKLIEAHDIIALNLEIEKKFKVYNEEPIWDFAAIKDLNSIRIELLIYYRHQFKPINLIDQYNLNMVNFLRQIQLKNRNKELLDKQI